MKKIKTFYILSFVLLLNNSLLSQTSVKHIKGVKGLSISALYTNSGYGGQIGGLYYLSSKINIESKVNYEKGEVGYTNYNIYTLNNSLFYNLYNNKNLFLNAKTGINIGYEVLTSNIEDELENNYLVMFGVIGLQTIYYVSDNISLFVDIQENIGKSEMGINYLQINGGIKILLKHISKKKSKKIKKNKIHIKPIVTPTKN